MIGRAIHLSDIELKKKADEEDLSIVLSFFNQISERLPNMKGFSYSIHKALNYSLEFDLGFEQALMKLNSQNKGNLIRFDDSGWFNSLKTKMSRLVFLNSLIYASGLLDFRDEIMTRSIDTIFSPPVRDGDKGRKQAQIPSAPTVSFPSRRDLERFGRKQEKKEPKSSRIPLKVDKSGKLGGKER